MLLLKIDSALILSTRAIFIITRAQYALGLCVCVRLYVCVCVDKKHACLRLTA